MKIGLRFLGLVLFIGMIFYADENDLLKKLPTMWKSFLEQKTIVIKPTTIPLPSTTELNVLANSERSHEQTECRIVKTQQVRTEIKRVYRWRDENGALHFSDKAPTSNLVDVKLDRTIRRDKKFSINIDTYRASIPAFLQDRIRTSSESIYRFLSTPLKPDQIQQADIRLHIHGDKRTFIQAYGNIQPGQISPAGFYTSATNEAFVLAQREHKQTEIVAIHETAHVIIAALYQRTPVWLNEGIAEFFEVMPDSVIRPGYKPKPEWIRTLAKNNILPLNQLLTLNHDQWKSLPPEQSYASAWATVYFLMKTNKGRNVLHQLLAEIKARPCEPVSSRSMIERLYPGGIRKLEEDVNRWVSNNA